jgi:hypothetical protein
LRLHDLGVVRAVFYDPYQLHSIALNLTRKGVRMIELPQTARRIEADQALYDAIIGRTLAHTNDQELNAHIKNAIAVESVRGFRIAKDKTSKMIDLAVALSMSHFGALQEFKRYGQAEVMPNFFYEYQGTSLDDFVNIGGRWAYIPERARNAHPPGVTWRTCKKRNKGCEACIGELEAEGYFDQQEKEAEFWRSNLPDEPPSIIESRLEFLRQLGYNEDWAIQKRYEENKQDDIQRNFVSWRRNHKKELEG